MSIPAARQKLELLAKQLNAGDAGPKFGALMIRQIIEEEMFRESPISRAPRKIRPLTDDQIFLIRKQHQLRPDMSQLEIAKMFDTNPGRVSEALNGKV